MNLPTPVYGHSRRHVMSCLQFLNEKKTRTSQWPLCVALLLGPVATPRPTHRRHTAGLHPAALGLVFRSWWQPVVRSERGR